MKTCSILSSLALASSAFAAAVPPRNPTEAESISSLSPLFERNPVCNAKRDALLDTVQNGAASGIAVAAYTAGSAAIANAVCVAINANRPGGDPANCQTYAAGVAGGVLIIFTAIEQNRQGTETTPRRSTTSFSDLLVARLNASGVGFDDISDISDNYGRVHVDRVANTTHTVLQQASIARLQHGDSHSNVLATIYTDGTGNIVTTPTSNTSMPISKRHDGAGFKINYRVIKEGSFLGTPDTSAGLPLAQSISLDWADQADNHAIDEYFATASIKNFATFGLRIISETNGFGDEYESVDICGQLVSSHDEL